MTQAVGRMLETEAWKVFQTINQQRQQLHWKQAGQVSACGRERLFPFGVWFTPQRGCCPLHAAFGAQNVFPRCENRSSLSVSWKAYSVIDLQRPVAVNVLFNNSDINKRELMKKKKKNHDGLLVMKLVTKECVTWYVIVFFFSTSFFLTTSNTTTPKPISPSKSFTQKNRLIDEW